MTLLRSIFRFRERGQVLMMAAGLLPVLLGMTGMAVDLGSYSGERRTLQNAADSIALAAAQELPNKILAEQTGWAWAAKNNIDPAGVTITASGTNVAAGEQPQVRVVIDRSHEFSFIRILGIDEAAVNGKATAQKVSLGGAAGIVPWSVTQATADWANAQGDGALITMKYDADGGDNGNFGAIRIDGPGADTYNTSVMYGSTSVACAVSAPNCTVGACPGTYPATCAETSPTCDGPDCTPQTGNVIGPTRTAVEFRMSSIYNLSTCDTFAEVFGTANADGKFELAPGCNPWTDGSGSCATNTSLCSRRVIIIPVVDSFGNGVSDPATIQRFALVYLEGYDAGKCQGNICEIKGRFVNADVSLNALAGLYDPTAAVHFVRLSE